MYSGRVISGFGIGGISAVAPTFVSECAPKEARGRITGLVQIMVATGSMLSYWINRELSASHIRSKPGVTSWLFSGGVVTSQSFGERMEGSVGLPIRSRRIHVPRSPHSQGDFTS